MKKILTGFILLVALVAGSVFLIKVSGTSPSHGQSAEGFIIDTLAQGLTVPWSMVFIDKETLLFSERNGKMRLLRKDQLLPGPALTLTDIDTAKKMGLLGICLHPDFARNKYVYISYNYKRENGSFLRIVRYTFDNDKLSNPFLLIGNISASPNHTGCRLKFGPDSKLYITTGDADRPMLAQDLKSLNGKILRVNDDGSIPADNPFVKIDTARKEIWTYGHRNTQGIDFQTGTGNLYNSEHGPTGGDEVNFIEKGLNYGWPVIHHRETKKNMVSPLAEFTPSIGPSEILFYNGDGFPKLKGSLLMATLRGESIVAMQIANQKIIASEKLIDHQYGRIRALTVGPEGNIYFSTSQNDPPEGKPMEGYDMILRIRPANSGTGMQSNATNIPGNLSNSSVRKSTKELYYELCAGCHGGNLEGSERAKSMVDGQWEYGGGKEDIMKSIRDGIIQKGMPAWEGALTSKEIKSLTGYIIKVNKKNNMGENRKK